MLERAVATSRKRARSPCGALGALVEHRTRGRGLVLGVAALVAFATLGALGLTLHLSDTVGINEFLAGDDVVPILDAWRQQGVWPLALAYLLVDAAIFVPLYGALTIVVARHIAALDAYDVRRQALACFATLASAVAVLADETENALGIAALFDVPAPALALAWATRAKLVFAGLAVLSVALLALAWFFAMGSAALAPGESIARARLRAGAVDVAWRNRYTLAGLGFFAGLLMLMDQSRDVLVGLAQAFQTSQAIGAVFVMVVSAVALWSVAYTAWMWSRILCRERRAAWTAQVAATPIPAPSPSEGKEGKIIPMPGDIADQPPSRIWPIGVFQFARWFARMAGAVPVLVLVALCGSAAADAARAGATLSAYLLLVFAGLSLAGAIAFLWRRNGAGAVVPLEAYYEGRVADADVHDELTSERYRFLFMRHAPLTLPLFALVSLSALRLLNIISPELPSVALAVICFSVALWLGVLGLVSQLALRHGRPYPLALLILVALLGWGGCTDNHVVWAPASAVSDGGWSTYGLWVFHAAIVAVVMAGAWTAYRWRPRGLRAALLAAFVAVAMGAVLVTADRLVPRSLARIDTAPPTERPSIDTALDQWLASLCGAGTSCATGRDEPLPVYFVASEGGGIRAAYWTALVLGQLSERIPGFAARTFAISGVSGGAIGAAVHRACTANPQDDVGGCIRHFGREDLLTPLVSAWMFEDVLGRVVPTSRCATPGCGILTRGAWFEQALERAAPGLQRHLVAEPSTRTSPYLLLNATWVETGERAIASDLAVESRYFPTARDQAAILGHDLTLTSAAHNAARFPFVNAIGTVRSGGGACPDARDDDVGHETRRSVCGHVADGGYFDNSGGHSIADALRALAKRLHEPSSPSLPEERAAWLRRNLVPQVIMIRNGLEARKVRIESREEAAPREHVRCDASDPSLPRCKGRFWLLTDLLGPAVAAFNAVGTGANGRLAESLLAPTVAGMRHELAAPIDMPAVVTFDLEARDVLYPLGWYLSTRARACMEQHAQRSDRYRDLCAPIDGACLDRAQRATLPTADDSCM